MHLTAKNNIIWKNENMREVLFFFFQVKHCKLQTNELFLPALFAILAKRNFETKYCFKSVKS